MHQIPAAPQMDAPAAGRPEIAALLAAARRDDLATGAGRTVWRRWGQGPHLVLLHGSHGSWMHWLRNIAALARHFTVHCPDLPGYGDSDAAPRGLEMPGYAAILAEALERAIPRPERIAVCGFSFGGLVAAHACTGQRDRLDRLVLAGSAGYLRRSQAPLPELVSWRGVPDEAAQLAAHRNNLARMMYHDPARIGDLALAIQRHNTERARQPARMLVRGSSLAACLAGAGLPLAGLWGAHDILAGEVQGRIDQLREWDPAAPCAVIPDAGHWAQFECPDAFDAALLAVLRPNAAPAGSPRPVNNPTE